MPRPINVYDNIISKFVDFINIKNINTILNQIHLSSNLEFAGASAQTIGIPDNLPTDIWPYGGQSFLYPITGQTITVEPGPNVLLNNVNASAVIPATNFNIPGILTRRNINDWILNIPQTGGGGGGGATGGLNIFTVINVNTARNLGSADANALVLYVAAGTTNVTINENLSDVDFPLFNITYITRGTDGTTALIPQNANVNINGVSATINIVSAGASNFDLRILMRVGTNEYFLLPGS